MQKPKPVYCNFCGVSNYEIEFMVAGPAVGTAFHAGTSLHICSACIEACNAAKEDYLKAKGDIEYNSCLYTENTENTNANHN